MVEVTCRRKACSYSTSQHRKLIKEKNKNKRVYFPYLLNWKEKKKKRELYWRKRRILKIKCSNLVYSHLCSVFLCGCHMQTARSAVSLVESPRAFFCTEHGSKIPRSQLPRHGPVILTKKLETLHATISASHSTPDSNWNPGPCTSFLEFPFYFYFLAWKSSNTLLCRQTFNVKGPNEKNTWLIRRLIS